jgi:leucyl-tRNA synthetase
MMEALDQLLDEEQDIKTAVMVNGKLLGKIRVKKDAPEGVVRAAAEAVESVARHMAGKRVVRVIHVPDRTLNFVVKG